LTNNTGTLTGTTTVATVNGVATFSNLAITAVGAGSTLTATAPGLGAGSIKLNVNGWSQTTASGGTVASVSARGSSVVVATSSGVFTSADGGATFTQALTESAAIVARDPVHGTVYADDPQHALSKSADGLNWKSTGTPISVSPTKLTTVA